MTRTDALRRPLVVVAADRIDRHGHAAHAVLHGYVHAASEQAGVMALGLPAEAGAFDIESLIDGIDGLLLTGSPSNVSPERYGAPSLPDEVLLDPARDAAVLPLVRRSAAAGVPILGVCRGFQEINVAFGGTLDAAVHTRPGRLDHREGDHNRPIEHWYEDSHSIDIAPGGMLANLLGKQRVRVNSLHHQGIDRLGQGLRVEATAPDGLVEAFSVEGAPAFALAVQFHPEMRIHDCPLAQAIFTAFGVACRQRLMRRLRSIEPAPALAQILSKAKQT
ncbi:putative glutamine amidotransferase [Bradyrhizobium elkanii]|uniref:gamma-glutamyl-gamma-aminobutyrate hydrolase n=1 Tax=Bradyrhizobium japonicum TaxID=375 RepID=A0A1L3F6D7_BRAJP|nr:MULTISPECIES: gamma-glutamyl-gamma-aminobutyrate hydrolase family protein [Bradyrhizobium]APG08876.1 gamma-glutamyl-gamma-aminobutyrate hydrolase [Bradyrhizobium japonicum]MCS3927156.1 putative glutamine amidotransferase [Bradyrhizobium elkanii]MCS3967709.1 putative glutamine amidotransferase [Bradyrhizobium japonicum]